MMPLVEDAESIQAIRETLRRLVTDGLMPFNVGDNGRHLLELGVVKAARAKLDAAADDEASRYEADTEALRDVLEHAIEHEYISGKHRRLLVDVLPLRQELLGRSVKERRTAAGKDIKPGTRPVAAGTIRNYYEPKALDKLASVLWMMELEFRATSSHDAQADSEDSVS